MFIGNRLINFMYNDYKAKFHNLEFSILAFIIAQKSMCKWNVAC